MVNHGLYLSIISRTNGYWLANQWVSMGLLKHDGCTKNSENVWINHWGTQSFATDSFSSPCWQVPDLLQTPVFASLLERVWLPMERSPNSRFRLGLRWLESLENWKYVQGFRERLRNFRFVCFFLFAFQIHLIVVLWFSRFEWTPNPESCQFWEEISCLHMFQKKQTNECPSKFNDPAQNAAKHLKSIACFHFLADFLVPWFHLQSTRGGESLVWLCSAWGGTRTLEDGMVENLITKPDSQLQLLIVWAPKKGGRLPGRGLSRCTRLPELSSKI